MSTPHRAPSGSDGRLVTIPPPCWVISDTHIGHANILTYCPWRATWARTIQEHDDSIIAAWRAHVGPEDWVLHLGDVSLGTKERLASFRAALPGRIVVVRGNHDRTATAMREAGFDLVCSAIRIEEQGRHWIGRHDPAAFGLHEAETAVRLLHGHCHGNGLADDIHPSVRAQAVDCSLDAVRSIAPVPWSRVSA